MASTSSMFGMSSGKSTCADILSSGQVQEFIFIFLALRSTCHIKDQQHCLDDTGNQSRQVLMSFLVQNMLGRCCVPRTPETVWVP